MEKGKKGELHKLHLNDLLPTQFAVGKAEVEIRAAGLRKKYKKDPGSLHDDLRIRPVPVVIRGNNFYLVDHHHLVRALHDALYKSPGDEICVYVEVLENASSLGHLYFWKQMYANNRVYLFDHEGGGPPPPRHAARTHQGSEVRSLSKPGMDRAQSLWLSENRY